MGDRGMPPSPTPFVGTSEDVPERPGISLIGLANIALLRWRIFVVLPLLVFAVATTVAALRQNAVTEYTATSRFWNKTGGGTGAAAPAPAPSGIAGVLGQRSEGEGPGFLGALISSTELLRELASTTYTVRITGPEPEVRKGTLAQVHGIRVAPEQDIKVGVDLASQSIELHSSGAGLASLVTTALWPDLAVQLNYRVLELLNEYNLRIRQQDVSIERRFIEGRMEAARAELASAEAVQARFLETNRQYQQSPQLVLEYARLSRRVDLHHQVYSGLALSNEQARIEEVRNTPGITLFDKPEYSITASGTSGRPLFEGLVGLLIGLAAAIVIVYGSEFLGRLPRQDPVEYARFRRLSREAFSGLIPQRIRMALRRGTHRPRHRGGTSPAVE